MFLNYELDPLKIIFMNGLDRVWSQQCLGMASYFRQCSTDWDSPVGGQTDRSKPKFGCLVGWLVASLVGFVAFTHPGSLGGGAPGTPGVGGGGLGGEGRGPFPPQLAPIADNYHSFCINCFASHSVCPPRGQSEFDGALLCVFDL